MPRRAKQLRRQIRCPPASHVVFRVTDAATARRGIWQFATDRALDSACRMSSAACVELLLAVGAGGGSTKVLTDDQPPWTHFSRAVCRIALTRIVIAPTTQAVGCSPLIAAARGGSVRIMELLFAHGTADLNAMDQVRARSPQPHTPWADTPTVVGCCVTRRAAISSGMCANVRFPCAEGAERLASGSCKRQP